MEISNEYYRPFNLAKEYLETRRTKRAFRHLDNHFLKDLGFYREEGHIYPLSGSKEVTEETKAFAQKTPTEASLKR
ncbi:hypothetical protein MSP8886_02810 [Marinomonas spartinae]|uniref:Uncharacterized protein n=1 Tax=Marinomonas spartinae TaxID=1792290 RepID=A0A1A8TKU8_9GAMM|nr:hypothetical protein [Marinomonas spartinae]SBS33598.1 hypothetical protein MSP8886_02810 [Marinomonas spartinae]